MVDGEEEYEVEYEAEYTAGPVAEYEPEPEVAGPEYEEEAFVGEEAE